MNRKIFSVLLVLLFCLSMTMTVSAAPIATFVVDEASCLASSEVEELNDLATELYTQRGVGFFFVYTNEETLENYDVEALVNGIQDYVVMLENETSWNTAYAGKGEQIDEATEENLRAVYDATETYVEGVEAFLLAAAECFPVAENVPTADGAIADDTDTDDVDVEEQEYLVYDVGELLTDSEEAALTEKLQNIGHKYNTQLTVCTIDTLDGADIDEFADSLYDYMEFGYGDNRAGVMVLVCMDSREVCVFSNESISSDDRDAIRHAITPQLSDGDYADAFDTYADECAYCLGGRPFNAGKNLAICLVIGIIAGVVVALVLKGQLKSVRKQDEANVYVKPGSLQITQSGDYFMYRNVTRTAKQQSSSSSGGGSSRGSSSGSF